MERLLEFLAIGILLVSCSDKFFDSRGEIVDVEGTLSHDMIVLGGRLEDPYSVENMTKALQNVCPSKAGLPRLDPTDYYVRFLPKDENDMGLLEEAGLLLLDHPMDFEILKEGDYYQDPGIPEGEITWQYAVVDKDFVFPEGIVCEILDECYIAEHSATKAADVDWDAVEREAYRLTGNGDMLVAVTKADAVAPKGRIAIVDDLLGQDPIGVAGVKVSCNSFVKICAAFTDEDGYYEMDREYTSKMRYRIVFKNRKGFGIGLNLILCQASVSTLGKQDPSGVSIVIDRDSDKRLFDRAVVNNAAYDWYESCAANDNPIKLPPSNLRIWLFHGTSSSSAVMMQQGCIVSNGIIGKYLGEYADLVKIFMPDITIGLKGKDDYSRIYSSAIHELSHASHFMQVGAEWWSKYIDYVLKSFITSGFVTYGAGTEDGHGYCAVGEMWGYYVESRIYRDRYADSSKMFGTSFWFSPQIFMYLDERGMNRYKIFDALSPDVTDTDVLKARMISLYPESKSLINRAFGRYN